MSELKTLEDWKEAFRKSNTDNMHLCTRIADLKSALDAAEKALKYITYEDWLTKDGLKIAINKTSSTLSEIARIKEGKS